MISGTQNVRVVFRRLTRAPGTTLLIVGTLGLVLGANTLTFSLMNEIILNPLPAIADKTGLVNVHGFRNEKDGVQTFSYPAYQALAQADVFEQGLVGFNGRGLSLDRNSEPELVFGMLVSANYFDSLGVKTRLGRGFTPADDRGGAEGVVVLSDAIWHSRFGADPRTVGRAVRLNGRPFTVIGVAPPRFAGQFVGFAADLWLPLSWAPIVSGQDDLLESRTTNWIEAFGRLKPQAQASAASILNRIQASLPPAEPGGGEAERILLEPLTGIDRDLQGPVAAFLTLLQAATLLVALIALVNVSSLLLARSLDRRQESAVRLALGASVSDLLAPFAVEAGMLCALATLLGLALSALGARVAPGFLPPFAIPLRFDLTLDLKTFAFSALVGICGAMMATLGPGLLAARRQPSFAMREGGPQRTARSRWRSALVIAQVAFATSVLVSGSVFARYLAEAATASPGFDLDRIQITRLDTSVLGLKGDAARPLQQAAVESIASLPGVETVSFARSAPYSLGVLSGEVRQAAAGEGKPWISADWNAISPRFFDSLGLRVLAGRGFSDFDTGEGARVVVINEALAKRAFSSIDVVGRALALGPNPGEVATVVGLVEDASLRRLGESPRPQFYRPFDQAPSPRISIFARSGNPAGLAALIRPALARAAPNLPLLESIPLRDFASFSQTGARLGSGAGMALGSLGLGLAAVGLFGLIAHAVSSRVREIAIRMAMGATSTDIVTLVLGEGGRLGLTGVALGLGGAVAASPLIGRLVPSMSAMDPVAFVSTSLLVFGVVIMAALGPAWRASRILPAVALRGE